MGAEMTNAKNKAGRSCLCGYLFAPMMPIRNRKFESFAVVSDRSYQRFLKAEARVLRAAGQTAKLHAIARAAKLVGSLLECPACGRFLFDPPDGSAGAFYLRKEKAPAPFPAAQTPRRKKSTTPRRSAPSSHL